MKLVLASNNAKKLAELQTLFAPLGLELVNQGALGIAEADEPHITFVENALAKARHAAQHAGIAAIADDSGLCVDALGGAPGVLSARYASEFGDTPIHVAPGQREQARVVQDAANNRLLLQRMEGVDDRRAGFVSALVAVRSADDPEPLIAFGRWNGVILTIERGEGGFGYDPLMFIPILNQTVAELSAEQKNQHSHRALAAQQMLALMREVWHLE
jgi:XTP/dITP diphosphohydrolase